MNTKSRKLALFFTLLSILFSLQISAQYATLVELRHDCGDEGGYVEFELNGDPDFYTYYWTHGPESLFLDSLSAGEYTFVVRNFYGCVEEYDVEIFAFDSCYMTYSIIYSPDPCVGYINMVVYTDSGSVIDESALNIVWDDGDPSGLIREVYLGQNDTFCVTITLLGDDSASCCLIYECIPIDENRSCTRGCRRELIVNETNRESDGRGQYVELLVLGGCNCEEYTDLRGYILDDNNGYLIPAGQNVNYYNLESSIGANDGYLAFNYSENWDSVPNGSLLLIYDERDTTVMTLPADDPTDSNDDGVYVLQASDTNYFYGKTSTWNGTDKLLEYSGLLSTAEWEKIKISPLADGMQVRKPDGTYHHGVSLGLTNFSATNTFPLWITSAFSTSHNIQLTGPNYENKADFTYSAAELTLRTPGLPNSTPNETLIDSLRDCQYAPAPLMAGPKSSNSRETSEEDKNLRDASTNESIRVYPNPFTNEINIAFNSTRDGISHLRGLTISGQLILKKLIPTGKGDNLYKLKVDSGLPSGLMLLEFVFPSGERKNLKVSHLQMH